MWLPCARAFAILALSPIIVRPCCASPNSEDFDDQHRLLSSDPESSGRTIRPIKWGQLNFIHTTDTHGWLPGHLLEPQFSADWGDYISFVHHMRKRADEEGVDLLVVDTGDRHDGNGLSDATDPDGAISQLVFMEADLDLVTLGNHELYKPEIIEQEFRLLAPRYGDKFLTSNVDIWDEQKSSHDANTWDDQNSSSDVDTWDQNSSQDENGRWVSVGHKYRLFTTKNQNLRVLAFGFLFNFNGHSKNSRVRSVEQVVHEEWFQTALKELDFDIVVLVTHIPVRHFNELSTLIKAIRRVRPNVTIQAFGGHTHIRDYTVFDDRATALESGRFLETVGWASISNVKHDNVSFSRSYIDFNAQSLTTHSNTSLDQERDNYFHTEHGEAVTRAIQDYREQLNLTEVLGCVPQSYYVDRVDYRAGNNLFHMLEQHILPYIEGLGPRIVLMNTGSIRYDLVRGPFSKDSGYIVSPFPSHWLYIPDLPSSRAKSVADILNKRDYVVSSDIQQNRRLDFNDLGIPSTRDPPDINDHTHLYDIFHTPQQFFSQIVDSLTGGYVTQDDMGNHGDDTPHKAWPRYQMPNCIVNEEVADNEPQLDLVFNDFMKPFVIEALDQLGLGDYAIGHVYEYGGKSIIDMLPEHFSLEKYQCSPM